MRILAVCATYCQIMAAVQLKLTIHSSDDFVLVITDMVYDAQECSDRIRTTGLFKEVVVCPINQAGGMSNKKMFLGRMVPWIRYLNSVGRLSSYEFDVLIGGNILGVMELYDYRINNYNLEVYLLQDGLYNYVDDRISSLVYCSLMEKIKHPILKRLKGQYIFSAEYGLQVSDKFESKNIPKLDSKDKEIFNLIFNYKYNAIYQKRVYFLDQAFEELNVAMNDEKYINHLVKLYGADDVLVKLHPRTKKEKYKQVSCDISQDNVPLEVIILNNRYVKKLVTFYSGAGLLQCFCVNNPVDVVFLYELELGIIEKLLNIEEFSKKIRKIQERYPNVYIAENMNF